ncbi:D-alanine--D-alanine ligase family protein [Desulfopila aestuarii]|uniref:D-alanine--D-alanine ligase n=1 Tax=Desulfopila aestuarii DSM 18488 TaxID=1121416 RepID=A0A1M7Y7Y3_9BACT|nr:D-alanine--D-alanine ligase [Desulfopila aestuarii]SHO48648.1 D-alanine--D-alanine ligase [Desulfopila aestuarii DSM 18488]
MQQQKLRIALLAGGTSGEREVSLNGADQVEKALSPDKYSVRRFDTATDLPALVAAKDEIDFAFIVLHGLQGEDGTMQGLLDLLGIPHQGSGVLGSAIAMDKHLSKELYRLDGLPVAEWEILTPETARDGAGIATRLGLPLVVKPVREGSSLGMTIAHTEEELLAGIETAMSRGRQVMVEKYIRGRELTAGVLGNDKLEALPLIEIVPGKEFTFFDYTAKYKPGATNEICPAPVSEEVRVKAQDFAVRAHKALRLRGYSRTDMMLDENENLYLLETNTIPGMTATSLLPQAAAKHGLEFPEFLARLIELGMEK